MNASNYHRRKLITMPSNSLMRLYESTDRSDGYPQEWHDVVKHQVREEAGHRCIRCKHPYKGGEHGRGEWTPCDEECLHRGPYKFRDDNGEWQVVPKKSGEVAGIVAAERETEAAWRILTVHHLSGQKLDLRWWNLTALCQVCHLHIQGKVKMDRPWLLDHSEWFKVYAAGFYASKFLKLELSREETMARLEELLALGRRDQKAQPSHS